MEMEFDFDNLLTSTNKVITLGHLHDILNTQGIAFNDRFNFLIMNIHLINGIDIEGNINVWSSTGIPQRAFIKQTNIGLYLLIPFRSQDNDTHVKYISIEYDNMEDNFNINLHLYYYNYLINGNNVSSSIAGIQDIYHNADENIFIGELNLAAFQEMKNEILNVGLGFNYTTKDIIHMLHSVAYIFGLDEIYASDRASHICDDGQFFNISFARKLAGNNYFYEKFGYRPISTYNYNFQQAERAFRLLRDVPINNYLRAMYKDTIPENPTVGMYYTEFYKQLEYQRARDQNFGCSQIAMLTNFIYKYDGLPDASNNNSIKYKSLRDEMLSIFKGRKFHAILR